MHLSKILVYLFVIVSSCNTSRLESKGNINSLFLNFTTTNNYSYLDTIYSETINNSQRISEINIEAIVGAYIYLKKYSELDSLLNLLETNESTVLNKVKITHNIVKHLNRSNLDDNHYIENNIIHYSELIRANKKDSLAYVGLFINLIYLQGKQSTLNQIDSLEKHNDNFSNHFYEYYLRQVVKNYPDAFFKTDYEIDDSSYTKPPVSKTSILSKRD